MAKLAVVALVPVVLLVQSCGANDDPFTVTIMNNTPHTIVDHGYFVTVPGTSNSGGMVDSDSASAREPVNRELA